MAGCSKKQYAIMMQAGADGKKLASEMGGMEQEAFNKAFSELMGSNGGYNQDDDEDYRDFDPDSDDDYGFDDSDDEYNKEMTAAQNENADMRENEPASVDALYRPDEDEGPRESKGPADPNAPAGQVLYNSDNEEFLKDMGANLKNTQYGRQETLDEYYERVKDKHTDDMDDWKEFISTAYAMSPKEVDRYIELKEFQSREPDEELDSKQELLTDNDMNQIKKYAERYEVPLDGLKQVIEEETQKLIDKGASVTNAKNDAMESVLDDVVSRGNLESFLKNEENKETPNYRTPEDMVDGELKKQGWTDEQLKKLTKDDYDYLAAMYKRILGLDFHKEGPTDIHDLVNGEE